MIRNLKSIIINYDEYQLIKEGKKTFLIAYNDKNYREGNAIWISCRSLDNQISEEYLSAIIGHISNFEQKEDWVVFSLLNIKDVK